MTSSQILAEFGERIAQDGPAADHRLLQQPSAPVVDTAPFTAAVLADPYAPESSASTRWPWPPADLLRDPPGSLVAFQFGP